MSDVLDGNPYDMDAVEIATTNGVSAVSPDCREGKCRACDGGAWDHYNDRAALCECACHEEN